VITIDHGYRQIVRKNQLATAHHLKFAFKGDVTNQDLTNLIPKVLDPTKFQAYLKKVGMINGSKSS